MSYIENILVGIDITLAAIFLRAKERETISGWLGINYPGSIFSLALNWVFWKCGFR